jgi:PleD family two-component response regulator
MQVTDGPAQQTAGAAQSASRVRGSVSRYRGMRSDMLRILLADDHDLTRSGVRYLLEKQKDWSVCAEASNSRMAVQLAEEHRPTSQSST